MRFAKYHGLGNDFVIVDLRELERQNGDLWPEQPEVVRALCDRQFGIGADGVLVILPSTRAGAAARMRVLNADGSEAEMCGNGLRCVAKYLHENDPSTRQPRIVIDTGAGPLACDLTVAAGLVQSVTVDMGRPRLTRGELPMLGPADARCVAEPITVEDCELTITAVSMGNPHAVAFVDTTDLLLLAQRVGPVLEVDDRFPQRTNVELAHLLSPAEIDLVVWERGCGITSACGTGACATAVAACVNGLARPGEEIAVRLPGGPLYITVADDYHTVFMRGPAAEVFTGEADLRDVLAAARP